jgi:hypothetical protein
MAPKIKSTHLLVLVPDEYRGKTYDLTSSHYSIGSSEDAIYFSGRINSSANNLYYE